MMIQIWLSELGRPSFLKKRSKKLLVPGGFGAASASARWTKSLFASFSSEKEGLFFKNRTS
jgi:hypothetical protein